MEAIPTIIEFKGRKTVISVHRNFTARKNTEKKLKASESRYRSLIATMNDGFSVAEKNGSLTYVNDKFCEMLGYRSKEMLGKPTDFFVSEKNKHILREHVKQRRKGIITPYELELTRKDGMPVPVFISPQTILDSEGNYQGSFGVMTDLSELKEAEAAIRKSEQARKALLNATSRSR